MIQIQQLKMPIPHTQEALIKKIAKTLKINRSEILEYELMKQSIDARHKNELKYVYTVNVKVQGEKRILKLVDNKNIMLTNPKRYDRKSTGSVPLEYSPVIVGSGPAGLFCGFLLAKAGYHPVIIERGEEAAKRLETVTHFWESGDLDPESNVQFGEGGAGTFSDGKLNTLVKDPLGRNRKVLELFVEAGAPPEILYVQKPHLGTDLLIEIIRNIRTMICDMGGTFRFQTKLTGLTIENRCLTALEVNGRETIPCNLLIPAIGHSARDTFELFLQNELQMEAKAFAVGVRIEHPQSMINLSQYGTAESPYLGAASYKVTHQAQNGRGIYSFCMCPGGYVVNASSEYGHLAVNGMSYHSRKSSNANSAMIVTVTPEDFAKEGPLSGISFQRKLEESAYLLSQGKIPIQLLKDFRMDQASSSLGDIIPMMKGDFALTNLREIFPSYINDALLEGILAFDRKIPGFAREDALLSGVESRTSSPVRIVRDMEFQSNIQGIYPCGEGAGYAGGITSAAMDGLKVGEAILKKYRNFF